MKLQDVFSTKQSPNEALAAREKRKRNKLTCNNTYHKGLLQGCLVENFDCVRLDLTSLNSRKCK